MTAASVAEAPFSEYKRRLESQQEIARGLERKHRMLGYSKLGVIAAAIVLGFVSIFFVPFAVAAFVILVLAHGKVVRARDHAARAIRFYESGLARLDGRWMGHGEAGERFIDTAHPYSADLDLFGKGSLFELLCTARTHAGQQMLARWLCEPVPPAEIQARNAAVIELRSRLDFREELAIVGEEVTAGAVPERFAEWAAGAPALESRGTRAIGSLLAVFALVSLVLWGGWRMQLPLLLAVLLNGSFWLSVRKRVDEAAEHAEEAVHDLRLLSLLLGRIEQERFSADLLRRLRAMLDVDGSPPSDRDREARSPYANARIQRASVAPFD